MTTNVKPPGWVIFDIEVARLNWQQAFSWVNDALFCDEQTTIAFLNAHNANLAHTNRAFRHALTRSTVLPDGIGVDLAARTLYGEPFPANLNGTDFIPALLTYITQPLRIALIGARPQVLQEATTNFQRRFPWHKFLAVSDGYFDKQNCAAILTDLKDSKADIVLVALGTPVQELWIDNNIHAEHGKIIISVGALFDFVSETAPRAPPIVRAMRCEWVYRLLHEPGRLWLRYLIGNPLFVYRVLRQKILVKHPA